jgi:multicomponent Na+:H+ antiporter subunit E
MSPESRFAGVIRGTRRGVLLRRWLALSIWTFGAWVLLSWTKSADQLVFGAVAAALIGLILTALGPVLEPWKLLDPRRLVLVVRIGAYVVVHLVAANVSLSRRIWSPSLPLRPGMVVVPTAAASDAELTAVGLLTSLIVDNQLIDVDRAGRALQYHAVWVTTDDPDINRDGINGPLEDLLTKLRSP